VSWLAVKSGDMGVPARQKLTPDRERRLLATLAAGQASRWCFTHGLFWGCVHHPLAEVREALF
jgi:hypothetical protein